MSARAAAAPLTQVSATKFQPIGEVLTASLICENSFQRHRLSAPRLAGLWLPVQEWFLRAELRVPP